MDWNLYRCGRAGHITYAPDEPQIREHLSARSASSVLWRCMRCGTFVPGEPDGAGPSNAAPVVRRGKEIRSEIILRVFAVERIFRFLLFGILAYVIWRFSYHQTSIDATFNKEIPLLRAPFRVLGYNITRSHFVGLIRHALTLKHSTIRLIAAAAGAFAIVELIEGVGLWLAKRWGEYFAAVVTSIGLPYEIYDLWLKFTYFRMIAFIINLALVLYLVLTKRLFGVRGGKKAYEERLRSESVIDEAVRAADSAKRSASGASVWSPAAAEAGEPVPAEPGPPGRTGPAASS
jgi:uncharacterized membrane protein (DUF2068 family)